MIFIGRKDTLYNISSNINETIHNSHRLNGAEQRIEQTKHWESELNITLEENKNETTSMVEMRKRIDKMIEMLREYLHIAQQCIAHR
jgi:alkyl sulfatase BDS1-like metallo-beta-lactamase superfamily hydrolase